MLVSIFYQIILIIGESVLLRGLKLGYEVLYVYGLDAKYLECDLMKTSYCMTDMNS